MPVRRLLAGTALLASTALVVTIAASAQAGTPAPVPAPPLVSLGDAFTTKTPYAPQQDARTYSKVPAGYRPVLTQLVTRHGSRAMSDADDGDALLALWDAASAAGGLTARGRGLAAQVRGVLDDSAAIGYGQLSSRGADELSGIAHRTAQRLPSLFASAVGAAADGPASAAPRIDVSTSSQQRTQDSAAAYVAGLEQTVPGIAPVVGASHVDNTHLYFHKTDAAYNAYLDGDARLADAVAAPVDTGVTHAVARATLERSFTRAFVDRVAAGDVVAFDDEVAAAQALYAVDQAAHDLPAGSGWDLDPYLTRPQAAWFGYLDDVTSFYESGPGFRGDDVTYGMADVLLDDMFATLEAKRDGTSDLVEQARFTHAEEIMPLAALLGLPGSTVQQPVGREMTYLDNPFRGARVAPMAANVQWDLYARGSSYLVRMFYDEKETRFKASCRPVAPGSTFYDLDELERCYGWSAAGAAD